MKSRLFSMDDILEATGGVVEGVGPDWVGGVAVDSRVIEPGDLFVALKGARVDGHDFLEEAFARGAHCALVESARRHAVPPGGCSLVRVADPWGALGDLARYHRQRHPVKVVGVTGSIGKTSTKDLVASVLREGFSTLHNLGNLNSDIGLPLTLFRLEEHHEVAVLEMAMRGPGQIAYLTDIAKPQLGVITTIDSTHMELLGSMEGIASAKAELLQALPDEGTAVLNWDCPWVRRVADRTAAQIVSYGLEREADFSATDMVSHGAAGIVFLLVTPQGRHPVRLPLPGRHLVSNALAAAAVGMTLGLSLQQVVRGLEAASISDMRGHIFRAHGVLVLNDAYNAHPQSMLAALQLLRELPGKRKFAVLGGMLELGRDTEPAHARVGKAVAEGGVDGLVVVGELAAQIVDAAIRSGLPEESTCICRDNEAAMRCLTTWLCPQDTVLIKGSRGLAMETIVDWLEKGSWQGLD